MKFKGNFGQLTLNINGTEATGTYQENGTLKGEFINNTFKGQWENKGMEGLVEFTITSDKLEGNWKKGLEPGPMKGKWEGKLLPNIQVDENKLNDLRSVNNGVSNESESFSLSNDIYSGDIRNHIEDIIKSGDKKRCQLFKKSVIDFINSNNASYWIIPFMIHCLNGFQNKSDDEGLDWDDCVNELSVRGKELDFNPKKKYSLFYNTFNENFKVDEDDDEGYGFFESVMKLNFSSILNFDSLTSEESDVYYNTSITTLYCTICKMCEESNRQDELVEIFLSVFYDEYGTKYECGDLIVGIISETLLALGVDQKSYEDEENLWRDEYLVNYDDIAKYLIDNDVFDNDYIPS